MHHLSKHILLRTLLHIAVTTILAVLSALVLKQSQTVYACPGPDGNFVGNEAISSMISSLQLPFIAGETWTVGGNGSFYGNGAHCNDPNNDYYATDWNRPNDGGAIVLPVTSGTVSAVVAPNPGCPTSGYGCYVQVDHANGYRTIYAHLAQVQVTNGTSVYPWTLIGRVGCSGNCQGEHLHLSFRHFDSGGYFSRCWNNGQTCLNGESPLQPQGYRPSPMMTSLGSTTLQDGLSYTSVNNRVHLPDLRNNAGWTTDFYVRNDGSEPRYVTIYYFYRDGSPTPKGSDVCLLNANQWCYIAVNQFNRIPTEGTAYIDGGQAVSVVVQRKRSSPAIYAAHTGLANPPLEVRLPLVHRNNSNWNSDLMIQNPSATGASVTVWFQTSAGETCSYGPIGLSPRASAVVSMQSVGCLTNGAFGARIVSNHPVAVVTTQRRDDNGDNLPESLMDYEAFTAPFTPNYFPLLMRGNSGWDAGIMLQNPNGSSNSISNSYYYSTGSYCCSSNHNVAAYSVQALYPLPNVPSPFVGGGSASGAYPFMSIVNQIRTGANYNAMSFSAVSGGTPRATVPLVFKNYEGYSTGISVQNLSGSIATAYFYLNSAEGNTLNTTTLTIQPYSVGIIYPVSYGDGFRGSGWVSSSQPIAVAVNHINIADVTYDSAASHGGVNR